MTALAISLPEELSVKTVADVKLQLDATLCDCESVQIEVTSVTRVDALGVQLLLAYQHVSQGSNLEVHWSGESNALITAAITLGVKLDCNADVVSGTA